jgi:hypothetical protein
MDRNEIVEYLEDFIIDYGNAEVILSDRSGEYHYTDFTVADLNCVIRTSNTDRIELALSICNREIERQETLMRCAEVKDDCHEWLRRYDLQGVYQTIKDILTGQLK